MSVHKHASSGTVLLVDDDPALLLTSEAILSELFAVTTASNGEEALELLRARTFDVVCTDYALGGATTGLDVLRAVGALPHYTARVLITGQNEVGFGAGYYVLSKPCDPARLVEVIERAAAQATARRKGGGTNKRTTGDFRTVDDTKKVR